jgi:hypothetical protein
VQVSPSKTAPRNNTVIEAFFPIIILTDNKSIFKDAMVKLEALDEQSKLQ